MKKLIVLFAITTCLLSCQPENRIYTENQELSPEVEWLKNDIKEFTVPIEDISISYKMSLAFRYTSGYQYQTVNVKVTEISPSGIEITEEYKLKVREANGDYIGDPGFDIWDSEHLIVPNKTYSEKGTYTYSIEQNTPVDPLPFAMEIGVILDKAIN